MTPLRREHRLVTVEGGEGAGKSTVLAALRACLQDAGAQVTCTREPGGTPLAERIRDLLLDPDAEPASPHTELLLMFAARAQHVQRVLLPALARGDWVLSDRFTDSSHAYQGGGRGLSRQDIDLLEGHFVGIEPGLTLLLDVDLALAQERLRARDAQPDRMERERGEFHQRVRAAFLARARECPQRIHVLDASQPAAVVAAQAVAVLSRHLQARQ